MPASEPVIAIIDVGKTNKKLLLFDQQYQVVYERSAYIAETTDEEGDPCENLDSLRLWVYDSLHEVFCNQAFHIKAINVSTYGASFVYINKEGQPVGPLYNYLKPFPHDLQQLFYHTYGGEEQFSLETASPVLGNLNSGLGLYRIKYQKPEVYQQISTALHLPQYISYLLSGVACSDITSIGCHTGLWNFQKMHYHHWVQEEGIDKKLAPILPASEVVPPIYPGAGYVVGIGLHDSSAALIPYQTSFQQPFVLISTGTWCISLNPFNHTPLTAEELRQDALCYLTYEGKPVKASRIFAGHEHEVSVKRIAAHFNQQPGRYRTMNFNPEVLQQLQKDTVANSEMTIEGKVSTSCFAQRNLAHFANDEVAYHQLIWDIVQQQRQSTQLVLKDSPVTRLLVDGGFSKNAIYMNLLAMAFPHLQVYAAAMAQATALGTALAIHASWNKRPIPNNLIELQYFAATMD